MSKRGKGPPALLLLIREYGFDVQGDAVIQKGVPGRMSDRIIRRCRSLFDAAEQLCPIIAEESYAKRLANITCPT